MAQGKKEVKKRWSDILISAGLIVILAVFLRATWSLYHKSQLARENLQASALRVAKLEERRVILEGKIERLKTPRGIEEEIRNNYSVVKEGEQVINIVENEVKGATTTVSAKKPWWQWW